MKTTCKPPRWQGYALALLTGLLLCLQGCKKETPLPQKPDALTYNGNSKLVQQVIGELKKPNNSKLLQQLNQQAPVNWDKPKLLINSHFLEGFTLRFYSSGPDSNYFDVQLNAKDQSMQLLSRAQLQAGDAVLTESYRKASANNAKQMGIGTKTLNIDPNWPLCGQPNTEGMCQQLIDCEFQIDLGATPIEFFIKFFYREFMREFARQLYNRGYEAYVKPLALIDPTKLKTRVEVMTDMQMAITDTDKLMKGTDPLYRFFTTPLEIRIVPSIKFLYLDIRSSCCPPKPIQPNIPEGTNFALLLYTNLPLKVQEQGKFLSDNRDIARAIYEYLVTNRWTEESKEFAKWAIGYLMENPNFDYRIFFNTNEFSGMNNLPTAPPIEPMVDMFGITDVPPDAIIGTPRLIAITPNRNNIEDMQYGVNANVSGILPLQVSKNDNLLFNDMTDLFELVSIGDLQTTASQFISRFRNRIGGTFENQILNDKVKESSTYKNFISKFRKDLQTKINNAGGALDNIIMNLTYRPVFNGLVNKINGLQILINDTEQTQIKLLNFQINPITQEWIADIDAVITDHFGLDKHDAITYQGQHRGFAAWWLLQHTRGYRPFITQVVVRTRLIGGL